MQLFKNPGVIAVDVLCNAHWEVVDEIIAHREIQFAEIATPATIVNEGQIYVKDFAGATEMCYLDAAGNEVQVTTGGVVNSTAFAGTLDIIADGAVYGKVVLSSLTAGEVIKLTDAGGDDFTVSCFGANKALFMTGNAVLNQDVSTSGTPTFAALTVGALAGVLKAVAGVVSGSATLDNVLDGATYKRVKTTSMTANEVVKLTDAGGDDLTCALGGESKILTLGASVSLNQSLQTTDNPAFNSTLITSHSRFSEIGAKPGVSANNGFVYTKDIAGIAELFFQDDSGVGQETQLTDNGSPTSPYATLDDLADGATYGRVLLSSLTAWEVTKLTDGGGDDLTCALLGGDRILTLGANVSLNQSLQTVDSPAFAAITSNASITLGNSASYGGGQTSDVTTVQTADATVTTLGTLALEEDKAYIVTAEIIAEETTAPSADRAAYSFKGLFYRVNAGAAVQEGATSVLLEEESDAAWDCDFDVNANNVRVRVTGAVATTINWKVVLTYTTIDRV